MSSAVSQNQVTAANVSNTTPILVTPSSDIKTTFNEHKRDDSSDDQRQLSKQNSNKTYTRGNSNKNKQLTRSHAMKESASPPRTPNSHSPNDMKSHSPAGSMLAGAIPSDSNYDSNPSQMLAAPTFALPESSGSSGKSQLDIEFPKLTPPKTKIWNSSQSSGARGNNRKSVSSDTSSNNNSLSEDTNDCHSSEKNSHQQKAGSQIISVSTSNSQMSYCEHKQHTDNEVENNPNIAVESYSHIDEQQASNSQCKSPNFSHNDNNNNGKQPAQYVTVKGKPPLKNMGSSSSCEGGNTSSGFISRDSSSEQFVDQNGIDLVQFFKETLNKNAKDRNMLMKIERDLLQLAVDQTGRTFIKFPAMSSYNRMLVHRTAAYFGMDHNVDSTQQCVIASMTKETRIPDIRFKTLIRDTFSDEPRKSILRREAHSFEDYRQGGLLSVQRGILNRKAKSFEEREEEYEKVRHRIFRNREMFGCHESVDEQEWQWIQERNQDNGSEMISKLKVPNRMMKTHSMESRYGERNPSVSKSHSFGGYGGGNSGNGNLMRDDSITSTKSAGPRLHKQDSSASTTWRLSPSSSGYKTQSLRSDSVTPSPTGYSSDTPEATAQSPDANRGVVWAVTDLASVPKGSLIIDPQTLQPIVNQDGSLYHFDPSNPPITAGRYTSGASRKKSERQRSMNNSNKPNSSDSSINNINSSNSDTEKSTASTITQQSQNNFSNSNNMDNSDNQTDLTQSDIQKKYGHYDDDEIHTKEQEPSDENKASQNEAKSQSRTLNVEEILPPLQKNQSTSPNLPLTETTISEEEESVTPTSSIQPIIEEESVTDDLKKDDTASTTTETPPVQELRYQSNSYISSAATSATPTMPMVGYSAPTTYTTPLESAGTIYHTGPDGTLYVLSQPVMYSYTTSTDNNDVQNCWVPIYDQNAIQSRDPNIATVMPVAYQTAPSTPYNGPTVYQSPVVYSTEQFPNQPTLAGPVTQYPLGYTPMGYTTAAYPVNGPPYQNYWPQPLATYIIPQATATAPLLVPPGAPQTPNATLIQTASSHSHHSSTNSAGRRSSPLANNNCNNSLAPSTSGSSTVSLQTFPTSVPLPLAASETTPGAGPTTVYAIPSSMYPNVLPGYPPATGFYQPLPHPQSNAAIISSVIPHSNSHPNHNVPSTQHSYQHAGQLQTAEVITHFPFNPAHAASGNSNQNATSTPQSAPSTPLSLTSMAQNLKNPPLFATPPILTSHSAPVHVAHYDDKRSNSFGSFVPKKYNHGNGIFHTPAIPMQNPTKLGSNQRQTPVGSYHVNSTLSAQGKKNINYSSNINVNNNHSEDTNSLSNNNMSSNYNSNRLKSNRDQGSVGSTTNNSYQPKTTYVPKMPNQQQHGGMNNNSGSSSNSPNSNENSAECNKYVTSRPPARIIPPSLDLKRNNGGNSNAMNSNNHHHRSTPNSTESNNSPNSITSYEHSSRNYHYSQYPVTSGAHFYRGGSAGAISTNAQGTMSGGNIGETPVQTCFPFNVHSQNAGTSTPLLDSCHTQLIGYNNNPMAAGMYVKFGQAFTFANPLPNNRKSPSNDIRPPLAGVYSMNMMLPGGPRHQMNHPRTMQNNHNFKNNRAQR